MLPMTRRGERRGPHPGRNDDEDLRPRDPRAGLAIAAVALLAGGAAPVGAEPAGGRDDAGEGTAREALIGAEDTWELPAVGTVSDRCTGTLVAPNVVLTGAHCFDYRTRCDPPHGDYGFFRVQPDPSSSYRYAIVRYRSFSDGLGGDDLALLKLARDVPGSIADPLPLSPGWPPFLEWVTQYGYGCGDRGDGRWEFGVKRKRGTGWPGHARLLPDMTCYGDSGGPVVRSRDGSILLVASGTLSTYAYVPHNHGRLEAQVREWSETWEDRVCRASL